MAFDDDDEASVLPAPTAIARETGADEPTPEDAFEEEADAEAEAEDFGRFAALTRGNGAGPGGRNKNVSAQAIRKGEKDFEEHGTLSQQSALERSRRAMVEILAPTRAHRPAAWARGWYFPDAWASAPAPGDEMADAELAPAAARAVFDRRREVRARDRVVVAETESPAFARTMGKTIPGVKRGDAAFQRMWLLPEEALFLVEKGALDLWWPMRRLEDIFPGAPAGDDGEAGDGGGGPGARWTLPPIGDDEYELGLPLSLEAAYSLLIGAEGERGKVTLPEIQVYTNLKRAGFYVLRPLPPPPTTDSLATTTPPVTAATVWQWLVSLLTSQNEAPKPAHARPFGPLVAPGLYRAYRPIFAQLPLVPPHKPRPTTPSGADQAAQGPSRVHFHVWKAGRAGWTKTKPPAPPDFAVAVADARTSGVPTLAQLSALLASAPWNPPELARAPGRPARLRHGFRSVLVAAVDDGIVNYLRFGEAAFGEEPLWPAFDAADGPRGAKTGGRGRGRGGRGGRGRGRAGK